MNFGKNSVSELWNAIMKLKHNYYETVLKQFHNLSSCRYEDDLHFEACSMKVWALAHCISLHLSPKKPLSSWRFISLKLGWKDVANWFCNMEIGWWLDKSLICKCEFEFKTETTINLFCNSSRSTIFKNSSSLRNVAQHFCLNFHWFMFGRTSDKKSVWHHFSELKKIC